MKTERYGRNILTIYDEEEGGSRVYGSLGADDADALTRFGRGRLFYAAQFGSLFTYNFALKIASETHPKSVLHLGCGVDNLRRVLEANYVMVDEYVGMDLHLPNLREALHVTNGIKGNYACYDLSKGLDLFSDNSFDMVVAAELVEHMPTKAQGEHLFREILRVAKTTAIISTPQVLGTEMRFSDFHKYELTRKELLNFMKEGREKFGDVKMYGINIGTKEYEGLLNSQPLWVRKANEYLSPKIMRGVFAAGNPELSNDVLMHFVK